MFDNSIFWWTLFFFWFIAIGIGQAVKGAADIAKKAVENETVQETGKGILAAWLESVFKK